MQGTENEWKPSFMLALHRNMTGGCLIMVSLSLPTWENSKSYHGHWQSDDHQRCSKPSPYMEKESSLPLEVLMAVIQLWDFLAPFELTVTFNFWNKQFENMVVLSDYIYGEAFTWSKIKIKNKWLLSCSDFQSLIMWSSTATAPQCESRSLQLPGPI